MFARSTAVFRATGARHFSASTRSANVQQKATEAVNEVQKKAPSAINDLQKKAQELGGPALKRVEGLLGGYSEPIKYNLSVASNIAKQVYVAEALAPPTSVNSITSAYRQIYTHATDKAFWAKLLTKGDWKRVGIYALEAYGIFTIGEMIGRRSLVGYKLDTSNHGHGHH
ncbi:ATPase, F0 complex, subunit G, mitochondrial [Kalmanozyma brasiliensis GHG001]|uniref:Uncharacterized protein n=1 Tax=Kalmanozyma brasiliensis (strain GHG001) TaxID=1365824 RepID=V5EVW1_KALBG|nr:ATPase, F0 complex, subunit G, mitochondrial [Kalmanozyma brasiliensis GHG001]EST06414.1 ATPase, F0 complex, subunit G, mitochondrial [Kalmanozyma brasiliensis GHG001]